MEEVKLTTNTFFFKYKPVETMFNVKLYLIFLLGSLAVSIGIQTVVPGVLGMGLALAVFISVPVIIRLKYGNRIGVNSEGRMERVKQLQMVCAVCGKSSKKRECPRCGSKQFRVN